MWFGSMSKKSQTPGNSISDEVKRLEALEKAIKSAIHEQSDECSKESADSSRSDVPLRVVKVLYKNLQYKNHTFVTEYIEDSPSDKAAKRIGMVEAIKPYFWQNKEYSTAIAEAFEDDEAKQTFIAGLTLLRKIWAEVFDRKFGDLQIMSSKDGQAIVIDPSEFDHIDDNAPAGLDAMLATLKETR